MTTVAHSYVDSIHFRFLGILMMDCVKGIGICRRGLELWCISLDIHTLPVGNKAPRRLKEHITGLLSVAPVKMIVPQEDVHTASAPDLSWSNDTHRLESVDPPVAMRAASDRTTP